MSVVEDEPEDAEDWDDETDAEDGNEPDREPPGGASRGYVRTATWRQGRVPYVLQEVIKARHEVTVAERKLDKLVRSARSHGASWEDIGTALGMSRQGAAKRFGPSGR